MCILNWEIVKFYFGYEIKIFSRYDDNIYWYIDDIDIVLNDLNLYWVYIVKIW